MKSNRYYVIIFSITVCLQTSILSSIDIQAMIKGMGESFGVPPSGYVYSYEVWNDTHMPIYVEQEGIASFMGGFFQSAKGYFGKKKLKSIFDADGSISKATYYNQDYYFNFFISDQSTPHEDPIYKQFLTQLPIKKNDKTIYYYHVYTQRTLSKGRFVYKPKVELIGYQDPSQTDSEKKGTVTVSSQLSSLNFVNSANVNVKVSLTYGSAPYSFTLEKHSYNSLGLPSPEQKSSSQDSVGTVTGITVQSATKNDETSSDRVIIQSVATSIDSMNSEDLKQTSQNTSEDTPLFSLRPNTITFSAYNKSSQKYETFKTLKVPAQGFDGKAYTIEIIQNIDNTLDVTFQGLLPGNYDTASTPRVRDLTPCPCTFWYQSLSQMKKLSADNGYIDLPGQIWIMYLGFDSPVQSKVLPGQVVTWNLTRPLISQGDQFVYFMYVATTDDALAEKFVTKLGKKLLGKDIIDQYTKSTQLSFVMNKDDESGLDVTSTLAAQKTDEQVATLMGDLDVSQGVIEDLDLKVIGYIVGADVFSPQGLGFGRFYYTLAPSLTTDSNIVALVKSYLDNTKTVALGVDAQAALSKIIKEWSIAYIKNEQQVVSQVEKFLIQYGKATIVDQTNQQLTAYGKICLNSIISGKISLKYPSLKLSTVTNQYVYDFGKSAPDGMPKNSIQLNRSKI